MVIKITSLNYLEIGQPLSLFNTLASNAKKVSLLEFIRSLAL